MTILILVETVLLAALTVLVTGLLRAYGTVLRRLHELDGGARGPREFSLLPTVARSATPDESGRWPEAHDIVGETPTGEAVSIRLRETGLDALLLFLSTGCASCEPFWVEVAEPRSLPSSGRVLVVTQGPEFVDAVELAALAPAGVEVLMSTSAWSDYEVPGSPHAVYVDGATGRIRGEGTGQSLRQVLDLLNRSTGTTGGRAGKSGELAVDRELMAAGIRPGDARLYGQERD